MTDLASLPVSAAPGTRAFARPFLFDGRCHVTVVVKLTIALVKDHAGAFVTCDPMAIADVSRSVGTSLLVASDLALGKSLCDVTLHGALVAPSDRPSPTLRGRLALFRADGTPIVDKTVTARGGLGADGEPELLRAMPLTWENALGGPNAFGAEWNPVGSDRPHLIDERRPRSPAGFAPLDSRWPVRARLRAELSLEELGGKLPSLPRESSWGYFQSAPPDLRVPFLSGDEWIVLEGMHSTHLAVRARLPGLRARAFIREASNRPQPVPLVLDTLAIDAHRLTASLVFRGRAAIQGHPDQVSMATELVRDCGDAIHSSPPERRMTPTPTRSVDKQTMCGPLVAPVVDAGAPFALAPAGSRERSTASPPGAAVPWHDASKRVPPASVDCRTMALDVASLRPSFAFPVSSGRFDEAAAPRGFTAAQTAAVGLEPLDALEPEGLERDLTPPAGIARATLRDAGFSEEKIRHLLRASL